MPKAELCGAKTEDGRTCQMPAGLGVEGSEGLGPCYMHRKAIIEVGGRKVETTHAHAMAQRPKLDGRMVKMKPGRLAELMEEMGATLVVDRRRGAAHVNLDFELACGRALLVYFFEQYEDRNEALKTWAAAYEAGDASRAPPTTLGLSEGHRALASICGVVNTMHQISQSVPKKDFLRILREIGEIINVHVSDRKVRREIQRDLQDAVAEYVVA